ncbi:MAG: KUP/HAK/KT family potassium transporter [Bacteroidetes bacterium]|uniref:Probable potassium transport system protein Kup n=1 Tax=Candidatus Enterocola intestinipullorum TaxID=2840783 RepID=A0A9D9HAF7_9BACT|nr:KUP/HAK/KT family potassium transporter [Candidatus Enterocola intestinipullorum]
MGQLKNNVEATANKISFATLLMTTGIVFGDIGTSPLYVMKAIVGSASALTESYVVGAVSCIIWTLTLQTTIKYVLIALKADNKGEGGILALYALLRRHKRKGIYAIAIIGASTLLADGIITPAITVTTAIEGLVNISPSLPVLPVVIVIISVIFFIQRFGTSNIGKSFGVFMLGWFLMLGILGVAAMTAYIPIIKAFNPYYAVKLLIDSPSWFLVLGAVFLCTTGAEALYSDLGHCGRKNITISWIFVKIMLILNYLGQGAWIITHMGEASGINPFYAIVPDGMMIFAVIMATGAAIVASQALISGSFSILSEAMNLHFWPRMQIKHPTNIKGQLYIPVVNAFMYIAVIATVLMFKNSAHMEAAYGLAITITMLMTTFLLGYYLRYTSKLGIISVSLFLGAYCLIEGIFLAANLSKFTEGGWFTLLIGGMLCIIMFVWVNALKIRSRYITVKKISDYYDIISDIKNDGSIPKYASNLIYINHSHSDDEVDDKLIYSIINKQPKRADHYWIFNLSYVDTPNTLEYSFKTLVPGTLFCVNLRIGFRIEPRVSLYLRQIVEDLVKTGEIDLASTYPSLRKNGIAGDFRFIMIHRVYYPEDAQNSRQNLLMSLYSIIRKIGIDETKALGLDTSVVVVERVPLIIGGRAKNIRRIERIL